MNNKQKKATIMRYPKINTIWKRDKERHNIIESDFSCDEFENIFRWHITEKISGNNNRIIFEKLRDDSSGWITPVVNFKGRTDNAQIQKPLLEYLEKMFTLEKLKKQFIESDKVILFGEGYGNKIQSVGKKYRKDNAFVLFDAVIDGWWLQPEKVKQLAKELNIEYVPIIGIMDTLGAIAYIRSKPKSMFSAKELIAEGIVARSNPLMLFRDGTPVMWKLKVKDYTRLEQTNG